MRQNILFLAVLFLGASIVSCSGSGGLLKDNKIFLNYSSGGGFSGQINGITVDSSGTANIWQKNGTQEKVIKKTFKLDDKKIDNMVKALSDSTIYNFHVNQTANMTTHLLIRFNGLSNEISYDSSNPPGDMPSAISKIIQEIKDILKNSRG